MRSSRSRLAVYPHPLAELSLENLFFWFPGTKSGFLVPCSPRSDGRSSGSFVERWYRRFTGSGGGAINGRRRCLSGCLVIYRTLHQFLMTATLCLQLSYSQIDAGLWNRFQSWNKKNFLSSNRCQKCLVFSPLICCFTSFEITGFKSLKHANILLFTLWLYLASISSYISSYIVIYHDFRKQNETKSTVNLL